MNYYEEEHARRIYYQDLVYDICNIIDRFEGVKPGAVVVCGNVLEPSTQV